VIPRTALTLALDAVFYRTSELRRAERAWERLDDQDLEYQTAIAKLVQALAGLSVEADQCAAVLEEHCEPRALARG